jgi:hypothetical protein
MREMDRPSYATALPSRGRLRNLRPPGEKARP